jgi:hypothetical protein
MDGRSVTTATPLDFFELRSLFDSAKQAFEGIFRPSRSEIDECEYRFTGLIQPRSTRLLHAQTDKELEAVLAGVNHSAPHVITELQQLVATRAFRAWAAEARRRGEVDDLTPSTLNREAAALLADIDERMDLLDAARRGPLIKGVRKPTEDDRRANAFRYLVGIVALLHAQHYSPGTFREANVAFAYELAKNAIRERARYLGVPSGRLETERDHRLETAAIVEAEKHESDRLKRLAAREEEAAADFFVLDQ